ncbi:MAG TPA: pitrilysin family protein [Bryobacteraceae bacterium]|nr:pitrilysin family protein [Bryobacteraceae bacterium]HPT27241.1 pitrilysin family protein [Bryobacteraceae bacterium]
MRARLGKMVNTGKDTEREIRQTVLDNGIRVITEPMPAVRSAAVGVWISTGSRVEKPGENGISHFIEHMLFKGTERRTAEDIAREVDAIGGHLDAFTGRELVGYTTKVLDEHIPIAFDVLADMLQNPKFDEEDIEKEKGVILEELKMEHDSPESLLHDVFMGKFWSRHPLGRPIIGSRKTIQSFEAEQVREHHRRYYSPANLVITAAGSLRHDDLVDVAQRHFGGLAKGGTVAKIRAPKSSAALTLRNKRSLQQVHVCVGVPAYPATHRLRFASYTLNLVLGGGMSSRLFQNIRERQGLAYSIFSELNMYKDTGMLAVYAGTSAKSVKALVEGVIAEFRRIKREALTAEELRHSKDHIKGSLMLSLESTGSRMSNLARQWLTYGRFYALDEIVEMVEAVTADEVQEVAADLLSGDKINVALLGRLDGMRLEREDLSC